jgi:hypothetical protein
MSFCQSRSGVVIGVLTAMFLAISRSDAANFDTVALELREQTTASVADFNLNLPVSGSAALLDLNQESLGETQGGGVYPADSRATVSWEILWQQPALIPVSAVPEPSVGTTMFLGVLLLRRWMRRRGRNVATTLEN